MLDQHCIGILFSQCCPNTSETTLHKKCWLKAHRYTFAGKPAVSNMSDSLFLTGYYITEQSWVFLFNVGSGVYLRIAGQQWTGADIDWNSCFWPFSYVYVINQVPYILLFHVWKRWFIKKTENRRLLLSASFTAKFSIDICLITAG